MEHKTALNELINQARVMEPIASALLGQNVHISISEVTFLNFDTGKSELKPLCFGIHCITSRGSNDHTVYITVKREEDIKQCHMEFAKAFGGLCERLFIECRVFGM